MSFGGGDPKIEETPEQRELARIAQQKYEYLRPQLQEAEDFYMAEIGKLATPERMGELTGDIQTNVNYEFDRAAGDVSRDLSARGVDPSSGRFQATLSELSKDGGTAGADAVNRGQVSLQDAHLKGLGNLVARGEGKSAESISGLMEVADASGSYARQKASESAQRNANRTGTLAMATGMGYELANGTGG